MTAPTAAATTTTTTTGGGGAAPTTVLPFTPIDEAIHLLDTASEPWSIQLEVRVKGALDEGRLRRAVQEALARHPMTRARKIPARRTDRTWQWEVAPTPDLDPVRVVDCLDDDALDAARAELQSRAVPLEESPPLRLWLARNPHGDIVMLNVNHAAFDGLGALRLCRSIARAYRDAPDPEPAVSLGVARDVKAVLASPHGAARARRFRMLAGKVSDLARAPARLAPDGGEDRPGYGLHHRRLSVAETARLGDHDGEATVNDQLMAALHLAVEDWNAAHDRPTGRVGVLMPVNLRPERWRRDVVTNVVLQTRVVTSRRHRRSPEEVLAEVTRQTRSIKGGAGGALMEVIGAWPAMPLWTKQPLSPLLWATGNRLVDTAMLSNLGVVEDPPDFGPGAGEATEVWFSAPSRLPCALSVGAATVGGRLHLAFRSRPPVLGPRAASHLADLFLAALARVNGALGRAGALRPPREGRPAEPRNPGEDPAHGASGWRSNLAAALTVLRPGPPADRSPTAPPLPQARVVHVEGRGEMFVRIAARPDGAPPPGPPTIVLLHGWALSADLNFFAGLYEVAAAHGRVLAPDLRGHGRGLRSVEVFELAEAADDVAALLEHLGVGPAVLVGYSMGGSVALLCAERHPEAVAGLVLASTPLQYRRSPWERVVWGALGLADWGFRLGFPEGIVPRYLRLAVERSPELAPYTAWIRAEMRRGDPIDIGAAAHDLSSFDGRRLAPEIDVPTAVVVTGRDRLVRRSRQLELAAAVPGATPVHVDGAHSAWLARSPEFNAAVDTALARVLARMPAPDPSPPDPGP